MRVISEEHSLFKTGSQEDKEALSNKIYKKNAVNFVIFLKNCKFKITAQPLQPNKLLKSGHVIQQQHHE